jgi:hypothetical protein
MFDTQINEIFKFIDAELGNLRQSQPDVNVVSISLLILYPVISHAGMERPMTAKQSYLVLSGGLGSSKYVQDEIVTRYKRQGMTILADRKHPDEPYVSSSAFPTH